MWPLRIHSRGAWEHFNLSALFAFFTLAHRKLEHASSPWGVSLLGICMCEGWPLTYRTDLRRWSICHGLFGAITAFHKAPRTRDAACVEVVPQWEQPRWHQLRDGSAPLTGGAGWPFRVFSSLVELIATPVLCGFCEDYRWGFVYKLSFCIKTLGFNLFFMTTIFGNSFS